MSEPVRGASSPVHINGYMIDWKKVPWTLYAYALLVLIEAGLVGARVHGLVAVRVLFLSFMVGWLFLLFAGIRWVWIVTVSITALAFVPEALGGSLQWHGVVFGLAALGLLCFPGTRRFFNRRKLGV